MSVPKSDYLDDNRVISAEHEEAAIKLICSEIETEKELLRRLNSNEKDSNDCEKNEKQTMEEVNKILKDMPLTKDTTCGLWIFRGTFLQRFANQYSYVFLYGVAGCLISMTSAYFNGIITTLEKRFKIPSRNVGIISIGTDISQLILSAFLSYYAGRGHRPRWMGIGLASYGLFCLMTAVPHFLYGPGEDALEFTTEYGAIFNENSTLESIEAEASKILCQKKGFAAECEERTEGNLTPQAILFIAQIISGLGESLYFTLGPTYMDDNTPKAKTPILLSISYFMRMLGPAIGYALASYCLRLYIAPYLHPVIDDNDTRWLGAWWLGWLIMALLLLPPSFIISMFPRQLPKAAARKLVEKLKRNGNEEVDKDVATASWDDMKKTFKRLISNKTFMCNNFASVFYIFGYTPYFIFAAKYIEIQYRQSAATSSMVTGTVALGFSALGILVAGIVLSKFKPKARSMAAWNVVAGILTVAGMLMYSFIGCPGNEDSMAVISPESGSLPTCNAACHCDYVRYTPVCGEDGMTYISPCHAGCTTEVIVDQQKVYHDCSCITKLNETAPEVTNTSFFLTTSPNIMQEPLGGGSAWSGACPVDCNTEFLTFLAVMCFLKFIGASARATNFLVSVRCVSETDKTASMGFDVAMISLMAFIPSPIFFGWILDELCLVWGKTCSDNGNCWLYDPEGLRLILNIVAAIFIAVGAIFDAGVWYFVKDLKIFDEEVKEMEMAAVKNSMATSNERLTDI